jgi:PAS domain S-box-containing protein
MQQEPAFYGEEAERIVSALFDSVADLFFMIDAQGMISECNTMFSDLFRRSQKECPGLNVYDVLLPVQAFTLKVLVDKVLQTGTQISFEDEWHGLRYCNTVYPLKELDGTIKRVAVIARNVTNIRLQCQYLDSSQVFTQALVESFPCACCVLDEKGRYVSWNAYLRDVIEGKSEGEMSGSYALELFDPRDQPKLLEKIQNVLYTGTEEKGEKRVLLRGCSEYRWFSLIGRRLILAGKPFFICIGSDVTAHREAEMLLASSKERLQLIMEAIHAGIWEWDLRSNSNIWSDELWRLYGLSSQGSEASYDTWLQVIVPEERQRVEKIVSEASAKGIEFSVSWRVRDQEGGERALMSKGTPLRDEEGKVCRYVGIVLDITEQYRAEEELRNSEERFRKMFESNSGIKLWLDPETGKIIDANQAAADFYGWSVEELKRMCIKEIDTLPPEVVKRNLEQWKTSGHHVFLFRHRRADGSIRDVEVFANTFEFSGKPLVYTVIIDVTERKRSEALRDFRLALLEMAENHSEDNLIQATIDEAERITGSTMGFCHFYNEEEMSLSLEVWSIHNGKILDRMRCGGERLALKQAGAWADAVRLMFPVIYNDYGSMNSLQGLPANYPEIKRLLVVPVKRGEKVMALLGVCNKSLDYCQDDVQDVSILADFAWDTIARKCAEQSKSRMQEALNYSQKMQMLGQLAGGIAHDFNNMLSVILGHIEMALEQIDPSLNVQGDLDSIRQAALRSVELTRQLLAFARKQTVMPRIVKIELVVENLLIMLGRIIGEHIPLNWIPESHDATLKIDPMQIDQILVNLCVNARDAISGSGTITIRTDSVDIRESDCDAGHPCCIPGKYIVISIADTGRGIEPEHMPHIFEPFFTTKKVGAGTGLGLSTVYGIVKQNNGFIDCKTQRGGGTTFFIYLPQIEEDGHRTEHRSHTGENETSSGTILLVEDEPDILRLCQLILQKSGYNILTALSADEALRVARAHLGSIQLLVTDVMLPGMNGADLAKTLQNDYPDLRILFMSGYTADIIGPHGVNETEANFIMKPFSVKAFVEKVREILTPASES